MSEHLMPPARVSVSKNSWTSNLLDFVFAHFAEEMSLEDLAHAAGQSKYNFCRSFRRQYGVPPIKWLWIFRTRLASELLKSVSGWTLTDIACTCGFVSSAHFSRKFKGYMGCSPSRFRKQSAWQAQNCREGVRSNQTLDLLAIQDSQHPLLRQVAEATLAAWLEPQMIPHPGTLTFLSP